MATRVRSKEGSNPSAESSLALADVNPSLDAFDRFIGEARALAARDVIPYRANVHLAAFNARRGLDAIAPFRARVGKELPSIDFARIDALPDLASAIAQAIANSAPTKIDVKALAIAASVSRKLLLDAADALVGKKLLPAEAVRKIHAGTGLVDLAQDAIDLAALFSKSAKSIAGKTAIDAADLKAADGAGRALLGALKPSRAKATGASGGAANDRDRLWTLFVLGWRMLWKVGAYFLGPDGVDAIPALLSAEHGGRKKKPVAPTPAST